MLELQVVLVPIPTAVPVEQIQAAAAAAVHGMVVSAVQAVQVLLLSVILI